jgi:hypothetical protein
MVRILEIEVKEGLIDAECRTGIMTHIVAVIPPSRDNM